MRNFTKTHNDLKWLFPIAKTKKEAEEVFNYVEELANNFADLADVKDGDRDLAIDCFMKGYSYCMQQVADAEKRVKEQVERADTAESVSNVLKEKVLFWQGLVKDITTVLGNNTDMFHECMDSWITRMVDDDDEARMRSLANSIAERLHSVKKIEWNYPLSCVDLKVCAVAQSHE